MTLPDWPRLMKIKLAAAYLDMSESKFRQLVEEGRLPAGYQDDASVKWDRADLDIYADNLSRKPDVVNIRKVHSL